MRDDHDPAHLAGTPLKMIDSRVVQLDDRRVELDQLAAQLNPVDARPRRPIRPGHAGRTIGSTRLAHPETGHDAGSPGPFCRTARRSRFSHPGVTSRGDYGHHDDLGLGWVLLDLRVAGPRSLSGGPHAR